MKPRRKKVAEGKGEEGKMGEEGKGKGAGKGGTGKPSPALVSDARFAAIHSDATFGSTRKQDRRVKLDKRFGHVLTDERFSVSGGKVDKYGRDLRGAGSEGKQRQKEDLREFYSVEEDEPEETADDDREESRQDYLTRLSRGEVSAEGSSSSSSDSEESEDDGVGGGGGEEEEEEVPLGEATTRVALLNCDWEHLKAADLMVLGNSFCPATQPIKQVSIYWSDYGLERSAEEDRFGPVGIFDGRKASDKGGEGEAQSETQDEVGEVREGHVVARKGPGIVMEASSSMDGFDAEKLRAYELQKAKYCFAVVDCLTLDAAEVLYKELDGMEFERSSVALDLRFIPNDVTFTGRKLKDSCKAIPSNYEPSQFICKALQHTKVECTWDEAADDRTSLLTQHHRWAEVDEDAFQSYLASSSSSSGEESEDERSGKQKDAGRMRRLLLGDDVEEEEEDEEEEEEEEMLPTAGAAAAGPAHTADDGDKVVSAVVHSEDKKRNTKEGGRKSRKSKQKEALAKSVESDSDEDTRDYDMRGLARQDKMKGKKLKGKRKMKEEKRGKVAGQNFQVDVGDERFAAMLEGKEGFGVDRTHKAFKETSGMQDLLTEKRRRRKRARAEVSKDETTTGAASSGSSSALNLLVKKLNSQNKA